MQKNLLKIITAWLMLQLLFLTTLNLHAHAKSLDLIPSDDQEINKKGKTTSYKLNVETGFEYSDNVFRLNDSQQERMKMNDQEDTASGRFKEMDSTSDIIVTPTVLMRINSASPLGGKFRLTSSVTYNYFMKNVKCSFPEGKLILNNSIGKNGDLSLEGNFLSGFFKKNYLSDVNDLNHNGNISRGERIYSSAIYDEYKIIAAYNHKILKKKNKKISGFNIEPFIGINNRMYNLIFSNRDQRITFGGVGATLEIISKLQLDFLYQYENVVSPNKKELVLYDEISSGNDINDDDEQKEHAVLITHIDRSSRRNTFEIKPSCELSDNLFLLLSYKMRTTDYISDNPLDVDHYHVDALRQQIRSGLTYKFSKAWSAEAEYNRIDDDDDEDGNYSQNNFLIKIKYNIF